jgi:prevent-host-death family protein
MSEAMVRTTISPEELAQRAGELVERVRQGELAVIESAGRERAVLLDATDYRLLRALAACASDARGPASVQGQEEVGSPDAQILRDFLSGAISLGKTAQRLGLSRFDLMDRLRRLDVPLGLGPSSLEDALAEIAVARKLP